MTEDQFPLPALSNEDARPAALLINCSTLVLSFHGRAIGYDGGVPVNANFDVIRDQRVEIHVPRLAVSKYCSRFSTFPCG